LEAWFGIQTKEFQSDNSVAKQEEELCDQNARHLVHQTVLPTGFLQKM